jgi:adenine-specific DNA-methyltransferase
LSRGRKKKGAEPKEVVSYRHEATRANNPQVGMVHADSDPDQPKTCWQYDPHLDPTLNFDSARAGIEKLIDNALASGDADVMREALEELKRLQAPYLAWTGKAEKTSFEIDTVSLHVHERVDPATILANAAKRLKGKDGAFAWRQADFFEAPFEKLPLRQALDFYKHPNDWTNRLIAGDSLLVMNSLLTKESMGGKVQMIYIDPPYGIKYGSNFQPFTNKRDVKDRSDADLTQEPEMIKAFRDTWELGIHSYLTYLRDRLLLARELLTESGSVFLQIGDENLNLCTDLLDEVFGAKNRVSIITVQKTGGQETEKIPNVSDYLVWYARDISKVKYRQIYRTKEAGVGHGSGQRYDRIQYPDGSRASLTAKQKRGEDAIPEGRVFQLTSLISSGVRSNTTGEWTFEGKTYHSGATSNWKTSYEGLERLRRADRIGARKTTIAYVRHIKDFAAYPVSNIWSDVAGASGIIYVVQTSASVVERCLLMTTDPGDLVLDPTCGSGTTAFVAEKWGRRWITCDTSRVAVSLAKQRLMTASFDYFALRYPHEGLNGGFDYETISHVTLKSIANNLDIDTIYEEDHPKIEAALSDLNKALTKQPPGPLKPTQGVRKGKPVNFAKGEALHEWEVPFVWPKDKNGKPIWPDAARAPFDAFHAARQAMQKRMDQSIADHAEQETLYDKPRPDKSKLRITGPFTVEAVPAPTVLSLQDAQHVSEPDESIARSGATSRQAQWRDELLKTGVRAKGGAMIKFAEFETLPGTKYLHASGSIADTGERVVVSFGPEHAALEQRQVELALAEAEKLRPSPKFVLFCAFTFDPEAAKDIDEVKWPGVTLLKAQMNTDLLTEDLKKKRSSNESFWLMGQPEVRHWKRDDGLWQVEVLGFDYFDPRKGDVTSGGPKQIAMWSLDTDYDERSMMPHQVFFPTAGKKDGWNRLKKTIRAELDEDLLEQFHGNVSLPFEAGENAKVAVKIVDDRGIESFKIIPLEE